MDMLLPLPALVHPLLSTLPSVSSPSSMTIMYPLKCQTVQITADRVAQQSGSWQMIEDLGRRCSNLTEVVLLNVYDRKLPRIPRTTTKILFVKYNDSTACTPLYYMRLSRLLYQTRTEDSPASNRPSKIHWQIWDAEEFERTRNRPYPASSIEDALMQEIRDSQETLRILSMDEESGSQRGADRAVHGWRFCGISGSFTSVASWTIATFHSGTC